jgi:hypothetical protein
MNRDVRWKRAAKCAEVTWLEMDVKDQFTGLNKDDVRLAMREAFAAVCSMGKGTYISIARLRERKKYDILAKRNNTEYYVFELKAMMEVVDFELNWPVFQVGSQTDWGIAYGRHVFSLLCGYIFDVERE